MRASWRWALAAPALALALAGCGATASEPAEDATVAVYVSAPLEGADASDGSDVADGARLALADAEGEAGGVRVRAEYLDVAGAGDGPFDPVRAAANARAAVEDSTAVGYVGELESGASRSSAPILNEADILQVAPGSGAEDLVRAEPFSDDVPAEVQPTGVRTFAQLAETYPEGREPVPPAPGDAEFEADFEDEYGRPAGPYAALSYEAMASILRAIEGAEDPTDRVAVVDAYFDGEERESVLGTYRITDTGEFAPSE